ncbi:MAG: hypothetical protein JWM35_1236 [Verrucomicrobia bacterium]|nr:hypothetical protein [Verrucomicrobiota bacterium]
MNPSTTRFHRVSMIAISAFAAAAALVPATVSAQGRNRAPLSKLFVASVDGQSEINRGDKIEEMLLKSAYNAQGSIIETKSKATNALVYSNGTGIFFEPDTRLEVQKFLQDPFTPNRNDLEIEPSVSQTDALLTRGTIGLCTSKLVAGTTMKYRTPLGSGSLMGGKYVIETTPESSKISVLEGEGLARGGSLDLGGQVIHPGEQAIFSPGATRDSSLIKIQKIPDGERSGLDDKVFAACTARKTVFFETKGSDPGEIVPVPVVPADLPVPVTVSPSTLPR